MTSTKSLQVDQTDAAVAHRSKSILFCPECGHESPVSGDWHAESDDHAETLRCPVCQTVVSEQ